MSYRATIRETHSFARSDVLRWRLGVIGRPSPDHLFLGILLGAVAGAVVGHGFVEPEFAALGAAVGLVPGALVGGIAGSLIPGVLWQDAAPPH